jgi:hypothetical protein
VTVIEPGDRVRVVSGSHWVGVEGRVTKLLEDGRAEVQEDGKFGTIDPQVADLELIAKGNGEAPAAGYAVGWGA